MKKNIMKMNGLIEILNNDKISIYDKELKTFVNFYKDEGDLSEAYKKSPEYFTNETLVSVYHFLETGKLIDSENIKKQIKGRLMGNKAFRGVEYLISMIDNKYQWMLSSQEKQEEIIADKIRMLIAA